MTELKEAAERWVEAIGRWLEIEKQLRLEILRLIKQANKKEVGDGKTYMPGV